MVVSKSIKAETMTQIIAASHKRCKQYGLDKTVVPHCAVSLSEEELSKRIKKYREFLDIATGFGEELIEMLYGNGIVFLIADNENCILKHFGDEEMRQFLTSINMVPGAHFDESTGGTSSNWLANYHKQPIAVVGTDHYHLPLYEAACYSVPFYIEDVAISGTITIMTSVKGHSPYLLALIESTVQSMLREYELRRNSRRQLLVNNILTGKTDNGVIIIDEYGVVTDYNSVAECILGLDKDHLIGVTFNNLGDLSNNINDAIMDGSNRENIDIKVTGKNGKILFCLMDILHIMEGCCYKGTFVQLRDMTEKYELEQQVIVQDRFSALGKLSAGLAHEIRNPLTSVMGFLKLLMESEDYSRAGVYMPIIYEELTRVKNLVSDFVVASKPQAPCKRETKLKPFLMDLVSMMESQANLKGVGLTIKHSLEDEQMEMDAAQVKQVLINVVQNAIEACEETKGTVTLECTVDKFESVFTASVIDTGRGMDEETLSQIMTPFFSTKDSGTGLGMAVSYRIIESHGGNIQFYSKIGVGTRVDITLPY